MSAYINKETLAYPLHEGDIRLEYPNIGEEFILPEKYALVKDTPQPTIDQTKNEYIVEKPPIFSDDGWVKQWEVRTLTEEEITKLKEFMDRIRKEKNGGDIPNNLSNDVPGSAPDVIG